MAARDLYSRDDDTRTADGGSLYQPPAFDLEYSFDNIQRPTEVTVSDRNAGASIFTSWLTVDVDHAIPVERCR